MCARRSNRRTTRAAHGWGSHTDQGKTRELVSAILIPSLSFAPVQPLPQRHLGSGYGRAARLIDAMAEDGIVGDDNGGQAREVLDNLDQWEAIKASRVPMDAAV